MDKTNVMRLLDAAKIEYVEKTYDAELTDGESIAKILGEDPECVFKTLVTVSDKKAYFVFCVPVNGTLNLKKAAKAVGAKSIAMIHQKELLPLTGYVHGGCSPIGLKKPFPVTIDETAQLFDRVYVSGGRKGFQIGLSPTDLKEYCNANFCDILA